MGVTFTNAGGITVTDAVTRDAGGEWIRARDNCVLKSNRSYDNDWHPVVGCKTSSGFWSFGSVGWNTLYFSYDTDANYNANRNDALTLQVPMISGTYSSNETVFTTAGGTFTETLSAPSFNATSSRTKKKNISDSNLNAVELIKDVKVVNYILKDDEDEVPRIGFIAEDTDSLLSTPKHNQMDMGNCVGVLIKTIQELHKEIEFLKGILEE